MATLLGLSGNLKLLHIWLTFRTSIQASLLSPHPFNFSIFFVLAFCLVFILSAYFISHVWMKWSASPVIITLNSMATPITEFPFPAITICNMNQARKSAVANIRPWTPQYSFLQNLCLNPTTINVTGSKAEKWPLFRNFMLNVSQSCEDMLLMCRYGDEEYKCLELFNAILTDEGLCCNFNGVHPRYLRKQYEWVSECSAGYLLELDSFFLFSFLNLLDAKWNSIWPIVQQTIGHQNVDSHQQRMKIINIVIHDRQQALEVGWVCSLCWMRT